MKSIVGPMVALLIAAAPAVRAQETTGAVSGRVVDTQGLAVPGATVTVTGTQGARSTVTDSEGRFTVPFVTPGTYTVHVELQGFKPVDQRGVEVRLGQTADIPISLQVGGLNETVEVTGASTTIDTTSTTIGANLDSDTLSRLPVGRRFSDTLYLAPGVSSSGTAGNANPSISGASGLENQYVVDGVNITNGGYGALGSYSIVFGSLGNGTPFDFVQEIQVKTGGYEAEYGQATGGVINVITKSGSNDLRGSAFGFTRSDKLEAAYRRAQTVNGTVNTTAQTLNDAGATLGGPVLRNRVFFFGAIDPQWEKRKLVAPPGFALVSLGEVSRDRRWTNYAAKGTWAVTSGHRVAASFFGDPAKGDNGPQRPESLLNRTTAAFSALDFGGHNQTLHYDGVVTSRFLVDASLGHAINSITETPSVNEPQVIDRTVLPEVRTGGIGFFEAGNKSKSWQGNARATHVLNGHGEHQIRYGVDVEKLNYDQINQRTGPTFTLVTGQQTATGAQITILPDPTFGRIFRVTRANLNAARTTKQTYVAVFVEDQWRIGNSITVRPGIRYEQEKLAGTIIDNFKLKNNWAPRVGVTWDPTSSGRAKVFASYGRYFARVPNDLAARALSADAGIGADYFDLALTQPIPNGVLAGPPGSQTTTHFSIAGVGADIIDPNAKLSYYNEYIAGFEYELFQGLNVGARYIHRDIGRVLEDVQPFPVIAADLGLPGAESIDYLLTNPGPNTPTQGGLGATFESPIHNYNAVEFTAAKRLSKNWSVQSSYRFSRLRGTYEGFYRDDNGQSDPGITSLYDFPTNDPTYATTGAQLFGYRGDIRFLGTLGEGPLPLDRPHDLKVYGTYTFPKGFQASLGLQVTSGKPLTGLAANPNPNYQNGGEIPLTPRGQGFQTSDGFHTRTPFTRTLNGSVAYNIGARTTRSITVLADVFNIFNTQTILDYNNYFETTFAVLNPDFGVAGSSGVLRGQQFTEPRQLRLGVRLQF